MHFFQILWPHHTSVYSWLVIQDNFIVALKSLSNLSLIMKSNTLWIRYFLCKKLKWGATNFKSYHSFLSGIWWFCLLHTIETQHIMHMLNLSPCLNFIVIQPCVCRRVMENRVRMRKRGIIPCPLKHFLVQVFLPFVLYLTNMVDNICFFLLHSFYVV